MSKKYRLNKENFDFVFKNGEKISSPFFFITYKKSVGTEGFAFVVPKKMVGKATERNSIRRKYYSALEQSYFFKKKQKNIAAVFISRKNPSDTSLKELIGELNEVYEMV